jgi:hypothetical protein
MIADALAAAVEMPATANAARPMLIVSCGFIPARAPNETSNHCFSLTLYLENCPPQIGRACEMPQK